ncbi:cytochrome P450 [Aspergillus ustus]|uniref:Cytochrome P450 n=1 Tax=Aspergillus ustus TaxID=40382 RepID=A0A0C1EH52_ASPUT|nr:cytochrome P450 [Aspergillus ustus]
MDSHSITAPSPGVPAPWSLSTCYPALFGLIIAYTIGQAVYNLYFHPLAHFPGPFLARASLLWRFYHTLSGRSHRALQHQHSIHGPVFRVSPNELTFASVQSWKDIYGPPAPGKPHVTKSEFYDIYGAGFDTGCIGSERDPAVHARKKKHLAAAFSLKALHAQDGIVQGVIDCFVGKVGRLCREGEGFGGKGRGGTRWKEGGIDVTEWYEMVAFDILGEMAFGEGFGCVERGGYTSSVFEEHHFWIRLILDHLIGIDVVDNLRRIGPLAMLGRRLSTPSTRPDFLSTLIDKVKSGEIEQEEMTAHASTLIIAGGETVATTLAGATYHLLRTPSAYEELKREVRGRYKSYEEIDGQSALQLPYLQAVINEALRMHPSGAQGFSRLSPGTTVSGYWVPKGTEIYTSAWTIIHDPANFHEPNTFKPERWIDPECQDNKEASQPFSLGLRACIGRNFAYVEMASIIAKLIFRYEMELVDKDLDWEDESRFHIMWWKAPIYVRFTEREA